MWPLPWNSCSSNTSCAEDFTALVKNGLRGCIIRIEGQSLCKVYIELLVGG